MFVRKVKRKCGVRGCKNTDCFAISRTREVGNTVIICKSCLGKALGAIDEIDPKTQSNIPHTDNRPAPPLFFNAVALGDVNAVANEQYMKDDSEDKSITEADIAADSDVQGETNGADDEPRSEDTDGFKCSICGKDFDSEKGLRTHLRYCKEHTDRK